MRSCLGQVWTTKELNSPKPSSPSGAARKLAPIGRISKKQKQRERRKSYTGRQLLLASWHLLDEAE